MVALIEITLNSATCCQVIIVTDALDEKPTKLQVMAFRVRRICVVIVDSKII